MEDRWDWSLDWDKGYSTWDAYQLLSFAMQTELWVFFDTIWNKVVPLEISLLMWQLLLNWLSLKDKLFHHEITYATSGLCSSGCRKEESVDHLFVGYTTFGSIGRIFNIRLVFFFNRYVTIFFSSFYSIFKFSMQL